MNKLTKTRALTPLAFALLLLFSSLLILPHNVAAATTTETFDTYTLGRAPCTPDAFAGPCNGLHYAFSQTGSGTASIESTVKDGATGNALQLTGSGLQAAFGTGQDVCVNGFSFAIAGSTTSVFTGMITTPTAFSSGAPASFTQYSVSFSGANNNLARMTATKVQNNAATTVQTSTLQFASGLIVANTFYHFTIVCPAGSSAGTFTLYSPEAQALGTPSVSNTITANTGTSFSPSTFFEFDSTSSGNIYVDNVAFGYSGAAAPTVGAAATTVNTMALTGFDVDPMDRVVIARAGAGGTSTILAFDPNTLALQGTAFSSGCNKLDGVMAYSQDPPGIGYTGFLDCTSATQTNALKVRNTFLGNPDQSDTVCSDFCDFDMSTQSGGAVCPGSTTNTLPGGSTAIGNIVAAPISWRGGFNPNGSPYSGSHTTGDSALIAFAFTDTGNGNVGIWAINQLNNISPDESCGVSVAFGTASATKQLCSWRANDGKDYMSAVSDTVSGATWRTDVGVVASDNGHTQPNVAITQVYPHQSPYDRAVGIACAGDYNFVLTSSGVVAKVRVLNGNLGNVPWTVTGASAQSRGIAVSRDGLRVAYTKDSTTVAIANATTGALLGTVTMPTGSFKEMRLDDAANNLYVATSTKISRYDLAGAGAGVNSGPPNGVRNSGSSQCTVTSTGSCGPAGGPVTTTGPAALGGGLGGTPNVPGIDIHTLAVSSGMSDEAFALFVAAVLILLMGGSMAVAGFMLAGAKGGLVLGALGVFGSFLLSLAWGLWAIWLIVFIFAMVILAIILMVARR